MKKKNIFAVLTISLALAFCLCACGSDDESGSSAATETGTETLAADELSAAKETASESLEVEQNDELLAEYAEDAEGGMLDPDHSAITDIVFSEGDSEEWSYSHNKREFPVQQCYAKLSTTAITKHFWGKDDEVQVYMIFTGTENCSVESTKGVVDTVESADPNVMIFKKTLYAAKSRKAETVTSEFKIVPQMECGLQIDVIYDQTVPRKYDDSSTIYFTNE